MFEKTLVPSPRACECCGQPLRKWAYDARTANGPWAVMCPECFAYGPGLGMLGTGFGQMYRRNDSGNFVLFAPGNTGARIGVSRRSA